MIEKLLIPSPTRISEAPGGTQITEQGEQLVSKYPFLVDDLNGLVKLFSKRDSVLYDLRNLTVRLTSRRQAGPSGTEAFFHDGLLHISRHVDGGESRCYILHIDGKKYLLKVKKQENEKVFLAEKERTDYVFSGLKKEADRVKVVPQRYLLLDNNFCLVVFEVGKPLASLEEVRGLAQFIDVVESYVYRNSNPLFTTVGVDLQPENFIKREDGTIVWVDPFYML